MNFEIREVTKENNQAILALRVSSGQKSFIESTEQSLNDANQYKPFKPVGLYRDGELVGFAMYGFFPAEGARGRVWLDRFLIDERFQRLGLGKIMLTELIKHIAKFYQCHELYLSIFANNQVALKMYEKFGFRFNGELDVNGEKVMVKELG